MIAGIVSEGPSDFPILRTFIEQLCPDVEDVFPIQPERDATTGSGASTTGWTGVRAWCRNHSGWLNAYLSSGIGPPIDILVIHVDLDVAGALSIERGPTIPITGTAERLCKRVRSWLGPNLPHQVVITLPAQRIETWGAAAVSALNPNVEYENNPERILVRAKVLTKDLHGKVVKDPASFEAVAARVAEKFQRVRQTCSQAEVFARKIERRCQRAR